MSRNVESRFATNPTNVDISRSRFNRPHRVLTTFNVGSLIPFLVEEVLPGDTFQIRTSKVIRMQTLLTPMMDNIYLDTYYFFVPNRLVWEHWKAFNGEHSGSWLPQATYTIPQLKAPSSTGWTVGTIADYMGIPIGVPKLEVNALPFRAYAKICQEWFNDENLGYAVVEETGDSTVTGQNSGYNYEVNKGGSPFKVYKYHDYFTSALPSPQKGPDVQVPLSGSLEIPVMSLGKTHTVPDYTMHFSNTGTGTGSNLYRDVGDDSLSVSSGTNPAATDAANRIAPDNLFATGVYSGGLSSTINELRLAFQIQKAYEKDARGGTRYIEILKSHFGVTSPDYRLQRPEYLGGNRIPINVNQVVQQSETGTTPQGNVAGYSLTTDSNSDFIKSFTEHGYIIGVMCARYDHTYQQGLERMWSRKSRFDFYLPVFANIGEQAIKNKEIYAQGPDAIDAVTGVAYDEEVFGYQEAWADYRYKPSRTSGEMRSAASNSLDVWHLGDDYNTLPQLSAGWAQEDPSNVDRVLAVTSAVSNQIFGDIYIQETVTRPMPLYSIPGLIDHH